MEGLAPRIKAFECISQWRRNPHIYMQDLIAESKLPEKDRALLRELATGVLRFQRLYRSIIIDQLSQKKSDKRLLDILSIVAHQIFALDSIPDHAICHTAVEQLDAIKCQQWKSVVNAVTRKLITLRGDGSSYPNIKIEALPKRAADSLSFEPDFIKDLKRDFPKQWLEIAQQLNKIVPLCTRWYDGVDRHVDESQVLKQEDDCVWWKRVQDALQGPVADGRAFVQDRSQSFVGVLAAIQSNELVLDYCAAPGGKTKIAMNAGARVVSADVNALKLDKLAEINPGRSLAQDGLHASFIDAFDCVIVDAPCSNSGVFARRPEARWRYQRKHVKALVHLQSQLLKQASTCVKAGGRLIYATCSINSDENVAVCKTMETQGWSVDKMHLAKPDAWQAGGFVARLLRAN